MLGWRWITDCRPDLQSLSRASLLCLLFFTAFARPVVAQDNPGAGQSLDSAANDPTASLMSFQLQGFYTSAYYNSPASSGIARHRKRPGARR